MIGASRPMPRFVRVHRLLLGACACALAGCTLGPDFKRPEPPTATGYAMAGDDANAGAVQTEVGQQVVGDWWTLFRSPTLDALMRQAIAGSPTLAEARARLAEAHAAQGAQGGLLTADATGGFKREEANLNALSGGSFSSFSVPGFPPIVTNPEFNLYSVGASVSYNLDVFGGQRRLRESLAAQTEAQRRELDAAYLTLTGKVVQQALIIADADIQTAELQAIAADDQRDLDMITRARGAGGAAGIDVAQAEAQLAKDQAMLPVQSQRRAQARHALAVLVGRSPADWSAPDFDASSGSLPAALPVALPSTLVRQRPDILEAEAKLHAATAEIGVATADLYPKISLTGTINQDALTLQSLFDKGSTSFTLGPSVSLPLFHSGELRARKREAEAEAEAALASYRETVLEAFAQVDDALQAIAHDNQAYDEDAKSLDAAQRRLDMARKGFAAGGLSARDLLDAQQSVRRARLTLKAQGTSRYADAAVLLLAVAAPPQSGDAQAENTSSSPGADPAAAGR
ncbi:MAG: efflux transporter outer membrane subunit [Caulobacteraceae bacterium]|nr:efflux transporter outer membrane subunit [Caulobacteraceae bacterium]